MSDIVDILNLLRRKEWMLRDKFDQATEANKSAHDAHGTAEGSPAYPFTEDQLFQMELALLDAQIALAKAEREQ